ncbi:class I SAM-dependent methyltransferase [Streptomyces sp. JNUCC 64]
MDRDIRSADDVNRLLDGLFAPSADRWTTRAGDWWDGFYADRDRPVPFFTEKPDESLAEWLAPGGPVPTRPPSPHRPERTTRPERTVHREDRARAEPTTRQEGADGPLVRPRALDLGCGPGRNALHLAARGFAVDAVDLSPTAVAWAAERARAAGADIRFHTGDAFAPTPTAPTAPTAPSGPYDLIVDSGCFHHLPPHRRIGYLDLLERTLAPGGHFALVCFAAGAMGSELSDRELYRDAGPQGGLAYTPESLRWIFSGLTEVASRRVRDEPPDSPHFGEPFLWAALFRRER